MSRMTKKTIAAAGAAALLIGGGATAAGAAVTQQQQGPGPRVHEVDADLRRDGRVRLEAETARSADRVTFRYDGRSFAGRVVDTDADDGTEDWASTVTAARGDRAGGTRISVRVRACSEDGCTTRTVRERLEAPDDDD